MQCRAIIIQLHNRSNSDEKISAVIKHRVVEFSEILCDQGAWKVIGSLCSVSRSFSVNWHCACACVSCVYISIINSIANDSSFAFLVIFLIFNFWFNFFLNPFFLLSHALFAFFSFFLLPSVSQSFIKLISCKQYSGSHDNKLKFVSLSIFSKSNLNG